MTSANFYIGRDLSLDAFTQYVQPALKEKGYSVSNKLLVGQPHESKIICSIDGDGFIDRIVDDVLVTLNSKVKNLHKTWSEQGKPQNEYDIWPHQIADYDSKMNEQGVREGKIVGVYTLLGFYENNETASQLFPSLANETLFDFVLEKAEEVEETIRSLLGKKLSDLI